MNLELHESVLVPHPEGCSCRGYIADEVWGTIPRSVYCVPCTACYAPCASL